MERFVLSRRGFVILWFQSIGPRLIFSAAWRPIEVADREEAAERMEEGGP